MDGEDLNRSKKLLSVIPESGGRKKKREREDWKGNWSGGARGGDVFLSVSFSQFHFFMFIPA